MKKLLILLSFFTLVFIPFKLAFAQENIVIDFFYSPTCPHCKEEEAYLKKLKATDKSITVNEYDIYEQGYIEKLEQYYQTYEVDKIRQGSVPVTFIKDKYFIGFNDFIADDINYYLKKLIESQAETDATSTSGVIEHPMKLPFIGEVNLSNYSPLFLSIVLGTLDGFNACAMVALGFLLTILISTGVRKRVLIIGGTFIFISGLVYFVFISAWLNLFLFLSHVKIITIIIGLVAVVFAVFLLKEYATDVVCKICHIDPKNEGKLTKWQRQLFKRMDYLTTANLPLVITLIGVSIVAAGINTVELFCSFGFPLAFTKMLISLNLPTGSYYFYLIIYVIFYMIDDFLIFLIALFTLRITKVSDKYLKAIKLISGIILLLLGIIIIFKPEILTFVG
ncbi:MAG: hypothetical protein ABIH87_04790 [bacterium]